MKWVTDRHIRQATLKYLNVWGELDAGLLERLGHGTPDEQADAIRDAASKYRVARHFSTSNRQGGGQPFWGKVLVVVRAAAAQDPSVMVPKVAQKLGVLGQAAQRQQPQVLTSAASKLMWFAGNTATRIYDTQAVDALRPAGGWRRHASIPYSDFHAVWTREFLSLEPRIVEVIAGGLAGGLLDWSSVQAQHRAAATHALGTLWFRERVFDQMLWLRGAAVGKGPARAGGEDPQVAADAELCGSCTHPGCPACGAST